MAGRTQTNDRKRVLCLGTLYQVGVQHALMGHELCNDPLELPPPYAYFDGREWYDAYVDAWASEKAHEDLRTQASAFTPQRRARTNRHRRAKLAGGGRSDNRASASSRASTSSTVEGDVVGDSKTDSEDY